MEHPPLRPQGNKLRGAGGDRSGGAATDVPERGELLRLVAREEPHDRQALRSDRFRRFRCQDVQGCGSRQDGDVETFLVTKFRLYGYRPADKIEVNLFCDGSLYELEDCDRCDRSGKDGHDPYLQI